MTNKELMDFVEAKSFGKLINKKSRTKSDEWKEAGERCKLNDGDWNLLPLRIIRFIWKALTGIDLKTL